jgi:hypothetical protein
MIIKTRGCHFEEPFGHAQDKLRDEKSFLGNARFLAALEMTD